MKFEFGVSICRTIDVQEIRTLNRSEHIRVIDLRSNGIGGRYPIQERVVRRLRNYWIDFSQLPTDMRQSTSRQHNELFDMIAYSGGNVLVITHQPELVKRFCQDLNIPISDYATECSKPSVSIDGRRPRDLPTHVRPSRPHLSAVQTEHAAAS